MRGHHLLVGALLLFATPVVGYTQICIPSDGTTVRQVKGQVYFGYEGARRTVEGVKLQIVHEKGRKLIAETTSDVEGRFSFKDISAGRYFLSAKDSRLVGLDVHLAVNPSSKQPDRLVVFVPGADISKSCGGGHVEFSPPL